MKSEIAPCILSFAKTMQYKLDLNKHKQCNVMNPDGKGRGWEHCDLDWLLSRILEEAAELQEAIEALQGDYITNYRPVRRVLNEAADVGNFAMMIHNIIETKYLDGRQTVPSTFSDFNT